MTEGRRVGRSKEVEGRGSGWGAEPHVNTSACPTGLHGQQATQTNRATDRQTEGQTDRWRDRQTDEERPKRFSGQTNDLEKPNESKRTKEMRERKILENMKERRGQQNEGVGRERLAGGEIWSQEVHNNLANGNNCND